MAYDGFAWIMGKLRAGHVPRRAYYFSGSIMTRKMYGRKSIKEKKMNNPGKTKKISGFYSYLKENLVRTNKI